MNGDFDVFENDWRSGKHNDGFYDLLLESTIQTKAFAVEASSCKSVDFTAINLAKYLDERFYEIIQISKINDSLVRSAEHCHLDLRRWGIKFQSNSQHPYFEGHERERMLSNIVKDLYFSF